MAFTIAAGTKGLDALFKVCTSCAVHGGTWVFSGKTLKRPKWPSDVLLAIKYRVQPGLVRQS